MLSIEQLALARGGKLLASGIDMQVEPGGALQIHGANGSGKTTLIGVLAGLRRPVAGRVRWRGLDVHANPAPFRRDLAYVGHANGVSDDLTVAENIRFAARLDECRSHATHNADNERDVLERADLYALRARRVGTLSQGQRRRVALARLIASAKRLWLLDEPVDALDAAAAAWLETCIASHLRDGGIVVSTTHRPLDMAGVTHHLDLDQGRA
ncbi:cytochrome c biogenesis heme-transporting ATPase CcmA [Paraburkholderia dinghuensis]|uniref:Cytochrome c biogenesis heme-transporting ATPase CcmA n=1 Tax=Paraburkholderia dinghuensis TaxID=2305225 RepID=A0A3N6PPB3_9BURK|nr:cytochrome c biogenesis heme-transporting ATPase CcmA [Paraburkholderia dinghuensis]RQH03630.1 cytochrome c biogenesis heme-transporting ATPase CcmA [Paraburkholderia dinghuensis]